MTLDKYCRDKDYGIFITESLGIKLTNTHLKCKFNYNYNT